MGHQEWVVEHLFSAAPKTNEVLTPMVKVRSQSILLYPAAPGGDRLARAMVPGRSAPGHVPARRRSPEPPLLTV